MTYQLKYFTVIDIEGFMQFKFRGAGNDIIEQRKDALESFKETLIAYLTGKSVSHIVEKAPIRFWVYYWLNNDSYYMLLDQDIRFETIIDSFYKECNFFNFLKIQFPGEPEKMYSPIKNDNVLVLPGSIEFIDSLRSLIKNLKP